MSRSGYSDDCENYGLWRGTVLASIRGKRGQKLLADLAQALDEMPVKELITQELKTEHGGFCTLGVLGEKRGIDMKELDPEASDIVARKFDVAEPLAKEIVYLNDEYCASMTPVERWAYMRKWVQEKIKNVR